MNLPSPIDTVTADNIERQIDAATQKRYRVCLTEKLHYTVEVLAEDEDEARDLALESEDRSETECSYFDADAIEIVPEGEPFDASNACVKCGGRTTEQVYPHCAACIEQIKAKAR